jgi:16S rRNA G966 N2-methylase RsmD
MNIINTQSADHIRRLYETPLPSTRTGPLYNAFSYPTKISPEAIAVFIATHTKPGATILDTFAGSGTTGLAAMLCDRPTTAMLNMAQSLDVNPEWGPRTVKLYEIGKLGSFVAKTLCSPPDPIAFAEAAKKLCAQARMRLKDVYSANDPHGQPGTLRYAIWTDILICPICKTETTYWDAAVALTPLSMKANLACSNCKEVSRIDSCQRVMETVTDQFGCSTTQKSRVLARVYGQTGKDKWYRTPTPDDIETFRTAGNVPLPASAPNADIVWGDLFRSGYHIGINKLHHFYTPRNFLAVATLWELVADFPEEIQDALRLLILSYNSSHSTLMSRVVVKKNQNDLILTGAQSGVLYVSSLPVEKNVIDGIARKAKSFSDAFALIHGSASTVDVINQSSEEIELPDASIDYIFTDPPFGDYIPYAEINQINEIWLGSTTDRTQEITISDAQKRGVETYGLMMGNVFKEMHRVLKPDGAATVVFHSAHSEVWRALAGAYSGAGFSVSATSVLDKIQASFKQVVSQVSVKGDPLILLRKQIPQNIQDETCRDLVDNLLQSVTNSDAHSDPQRLYSKLVGLCLQRGVHIDIDASEFYRLANAQLGAPA